MKQNLQFILTKEELNRIGQVADGTDSLDVHKLSVEEAQKLIHNIGTVYRSGEQLVVIHGYNHSTHIKDMLSNTKIFKREYTTEQWENNPGRTLIKFI